MEGELDVGVSGTEGWVVFGGGGGGGRGCLKNGRTKDKLQW